MALELRVRQGWGKLKYGEMDWDYVGSGLCLKIQDTFLEGIISCESSSSSHFFSKCFIWLKFLLKEPLQQKRTVNKAKTRGVKVSPSWPQSKICQTANPVFKYLLGFTINSSYRSTILSKSQRLSFSSPSTGQISSRTWINIQAKCLNVKSKTKIQKSNLTLGFSSLGGVQLAAAASHCSHTWSLSGRWLRTGWKETTAQESEGENKLLRRKKHFTSTKKKNLLHREFRQRRKNKEASFQSRESCQNMSDQRKHIKHPLTWFQKGILYGHQSKIPLNNKKTT